VISEIITAAIGAMLLLFILRAVRGARLTRVGPRAARPGDT